MQISSYADMKKMLEERTRTISCISRVQSQSIVLLCCILLFGNCAVHADENQRNNTSSNQDAENPVPRKMKFLIKL